MKKRKIIYRSFHFRISGGFLLLLAIAYFFDESGLLTAFLPAIFIHELGHYLALLSCGCRPVLLSLTAAGLILDYHGHPRPAQKLFIALSGPIYGLIGTLLFSYIGNRFGSRFFMMSSGLGLILNCFNLLPAMPLDGGRALLVLLGLIFGHSASHRVMDILSYITASILLFSGLFLITQGYGPALLFAGIWLLVAKLLPTCKQKNFGIL